MRTFYTLEKVDSLASVDPNEGCRSYPSFSATPCTPLLGGKWRNGSRESAMTPSASPSRRMSRSASSGVPMLITSSYKQGTHLTSDHCGIDSSSGITAWTGISRRRYHTELKAIAAGEAIMPNCWLMQDKQYFELAKAERPVATFGHASRTTLGAATPPATPHRELSCRCTRARRMARGHRGPWPGAIRSRSSAENSTAGSSCLGGSSHTLCR